MSIHLRAFYTILLICAVGVFVVNQLILFFLQPYIQDVYLKVTSTGYKGSIEMSDISYLMITLQLRYYIALTVAAFLVLLFLLIKGKYYKECFLSYLALIVMLLLLIKSGLLEVL